MLLLGRPRRLHRRQGAGPRLLRAGHAARAAAGQRRRGGHEPRRDPRPARRARVPRHRARHRPGLARERAVLLAGVFQRRVGGLGRAGSPRLGRAHGRWPRRHGRRSLAARVDALAWSARAGWPPAVTGARPGRCWASPSTWAAGLLLASPEARRPRWAPAPAPRPARSARHSWRAGVASAPQSIVVRAASRGSFSPNACALADAGGAAMIRTTEPCPPPLACSSPGPPAVRPQPGDMLPAGQEQLRHPPRVPGVPADPHRHIAEGHRRGRGTCVDLDDDLGIVDERTFEARGDAPVQARPQAPRLVHPARLRRRRSRRARDFTYGDTRFERFERVVTASRAPTTPPTSSGTSSGGPRGYLGVIARRQDRGRGRRRSSPPRPRRARSDTLRAPVPVPWGRRPRALRRAGSAWRARSRA